MVLFRAVAMALAQAIDRHVLHSPQEVPAVTVACSAYLRAAREKTNELLIYKLAFEH